MYDENERSRSVEAVGIGVGAAPLEDELCFFCCATFADGVAVPPNPAARLESELAESMLGWKPA